MIKKHKPHLPLVVIYARDWNMWESIQSLNDLPDFQVATGWFAGWLVKETKDSISVAFELFDDGKISIRHVNVIPKETILFKKILQIYPKKGKS